MDSSKETAQTLQEVFQYLEQRFQKNRIDRSFVFHFLIDEETWRMEVDSDRILINNDLESHDVNCTLIASKQLFLSIFNRQYIPSMMDLVNGRIKCDRPELLFMLKKVFSES